MIFSLPFTPALQKNQYHMGYAIIHEQFDAESQCGRSVVCGLANYFFSVALSSLLPSNYFSLERQSRTVIKRWGPGISPRYYEHGPLPLSKENRRK